VSAAASLSGNLLAVGGHDNTTSFQAINIFLPLTNSWVRITTGDLPQPRNMCTAVQLSSNTMMVIGGYDNQNKRTKTVFIGTVTYTEELMQDVGNIKEEEVCGVYR